MKRIFSLVVLCGLLGACAPTNQVNLLDDKKQEMGDAIASCEEATRNADKPHTACAICTFDTWAKLLQESNFKDTDLLGVYRTRMVQVATAWDDGKITNERAAAYFKDAKNQFTYGVQRRDAYRTQRYTAALIAAGQGLNQANYYSPPPMPSYAPVAQPSMPSMPPMTPVDTTLQDNYLRETQASQQPQPSIAQKLRDCSQAPNGCNGAFAR